MTTPDMDNGGKIVRLEISVWDDINGDVVKKLWDASEGEYHEILDQFSDEPGHTVVVDREWEETPDDE